MIKKAHDLCYIDKRFLVLLTPSSINSARSPRPIYWNSIKISPPHLILSLVHLKEIEVSGTPYPTSFYFTLAFNLRPQTKLNFQ